LKAVEAIKIEGEVMSIAPISEISDDEAYRLGQELGVGLMSTYGHIAHYREIVVARQAEDAIFAQGFFDTLLYYEYPMVGMAGFEEVQYRQGDTMQGDIIVVTWQNTPAFREENRPLLSNAKLACSCVHMIYDGAAPKFPGRPWWEYELLTFWGITTSLYSLGEISKELAKAILHNAGFDQAYEELFF
jgi:hypothetical protein